MRNTSQTKKAFSMIELIFVIVILGIVSSIAANIIAQVYESYIVQRAQYRATSKTELALTQIANRLRYAIPGTVGFRSDTGGTFKFITEANSGNDKVLQWVSYDGDSFEAIDSDTNRKPGWSGFCDIDAYVANSTNLPTPGSNLDLAKTIISNLGGDIANAKIIFPNNMAYGIDDATGETITLDNEIHGKIYERYKLAWTSYALSVEGGDLYLYYNFMPDVGAPLDNASKQLLLKNVTNFRFKGSEGSMRIKICKEEQIGMNANSTIHACKEKVIF